MRPDSVNTKPERGGVVACCREPPERRYSQVVRLAGEPATATSFDGLKVVTEWNGHHPLHHALKPIWHPVREWQPQTNCSQPANTRCGL
jgi:hypothetical protein